MRRVPLRPGQAGFTLVEVLVALALLGLISVFLFQGLRGAGEIFGRLAERSTQQDETLAARQLLRRLLEGSYPAVLDSPDGGYRVSFQGGRDRLAFTTTAALPGVPPGLHRVAIEPRDGALYLDWSLERGEASSAGAGAGAGEGEGALSRPILPAVDALRIRYLDRMERGEAVWQESWSEAVRLPRLVALEVERSEDSGNWTPLIVALPVEADAACRFDLLTGRCRGR